MHAEKIIIQAGRFPRRDCYPFNIRQFHETGEILLKKPVTFFVGENGSGKSTLLKAIARRCGIHIWDEPERTRCVINPLEDELYRHVDVTWTGGPVPGSFFASEIFHHFAKNLDEWASITPDLLKYYGDKSLLTQSHGQYHMAYFVSRYRLKGLYLLDEPENALSPATQVRFLRVLADAAARGNAQFIIATHSPILMALPGADILSFDHSPISSVPYEETPHFRVYRDVINNRERYFKEEALL